MSYAGPAARPAKPPLGIDSAATRAGRPRPAGLKPLNPVPKDSTSSVRRRAGAFNAVADRGRTAAFTAGITLGLLFGAGIALLLAPQTGADTRRALARRGRRLRIRGRDAWDDLRVELRRARRRRRAASEPTTSAP
jgi:hypothetical protein